MSFIYIFFLQFSASFFAIVLLRTSGGGRFLTKKWRKYITLWQKYNLTERRNTKMGIVAIRYYNVWFYLHLQSELDVVKFSYLSKRIEAGDSFRMRDIHKWCAMQKIKYRTKFVYRKDLPVTANLWNLYSYVRSKIENAISKITS